MSATTVSSLRLTFAPAAAGLALGLVAWGILFFAESRAAVGVWQSSDTYGHCFLILPMALYLAWDRRQSIAGLMPRPLPAVAVLALPIAAVWLVAERLGIMEGRQLMAIAALELLFLAVLGWRLFRALSAPLLFLVFLVPFGAFAVPALQTFTAGFIIGGLNLLGIPNFATDLTIEISAGVFYVAEACAGLRFLIAAIAFGVFYALLNYQSPGRRAAFMAASFIVPIVANGFRALGIVVLGSVLGSAEAAAADHIIFGWVFFSFVMLLLVAGGMPFREPPPGPAPRSAQSGVSPGGMAPVMAAVAVVVLLAAGPAVALVLTNQATPARLTEIPAFATPPGCRADAGPAPNLPAQRIQLDFVCEGRAVVVTVQAFPPRSTSDSLNRERRRLTGELGAEDVTYGMLPKGVSNGSWSLVRTIEPSRSTATATWSDGAPSQGGIAGRIRQARNSVLGTEYAPILATIAIDSATRPNPIDQRRIDDLLGAFVAAQPDLDKTMATVSRSARP